MMGPDGSQLKSLLGKAAGLPLPSADNWLWLSLVVTASTGAGVPRSAWWGGGAEGLSVLAAVGAPPAPPGSAGFGAVGCQAWGLTCPLPAPTPGAVLRVPLWAGVSMDYTKFCPMLGTGISHQPPSQFFFTFQPKLRSLDSGVGKGRLKITDQYNQHSQRIPQLRPPQLAMSLVPGQEMLPQASGAACGRLHQPVERADKLSRGAAAGSTQPSDAHCARASLGQLCPAQSAALVFQRCLPAPAGAAVQSRPHCCSHSCPAALADGTVQEHLRLLDASGKHLQFLQKSFQPATYPPKPRASQSSMVFRARRWGGGAGPLGTVVWVG